jgi:hypothetical protein
MLFLARMHELRKLEVQLGWCMYVLVGIRFGSFPSAESALWKFLHSWSWLLRSML